MKLLENQTTESLLEQWELTTNINTAEISIVRGWLMDELEKRNPEAFDNWLESECPLDEDLRKFMNK